MRVAPFEVTVVLLNPDDESARNAAGLIDEQLAQARIDAVVDDREERPGVKLRDAELVGIPYRITIGRRGMANSTVEVLTRATGGTVSVPIGEAANYVRAALGAERQ